MRECISTAEKLGKELRGSYECWNHILQNGAGDPFWEDGANMNLVRNHIIYYKRQCEAELLPEEYPEEYFWGSLQRWTINIWHSRKKSGNTP